MIPTIERFNAVLPELTGREGPLLVEPMPGGASTRQFFRVTLGPGQTAVAMFVPDATTSDEIVKDGVVPKAWPFLEVRDLLAERGVRVPTVLGKACDSGFILLEDLGDDTLAHYLVNHPEARERLYQTAVRDLAKAQSALLPLPAGSIVQTRAFDEDLLRWEVDHFREWALEARGISLDDEARGTFSRAAAHLARTIAGWPRHFVHRDYQSRNLMVRTTNAEPELVWIDFQDALLGPRVYDLVALLSDSYQTFDVPFIDARLNEYAEHLGLDARDRQAVGREFQIVTVQRKLKDAGRFVYIDRVRNNPDFLQFVAPTIAKVRHALVNLEDDPVLLDLANLLDRMKLTD